MKAERPLVEDLAAPTELRQALEAARARGPGEAELARLAANLGIAASPAPLSPLEPSATATGAAKASLALKSAVVLGAASLITAGAWQLANVRPQTATSLPAPIAAAAQGSRTSDVATAEPPAPPAAVERISPPNAAASVQGRAQRAARSPASSAQVVSEHLAASAAPPAAPAPSDAASRLREEALLVRRAQAMLATDPAGALRLAAERRREFPSGALGQEASVITIEALLRLGRRQEAETQARAFEAAHPGSVHARRMRKLLEVQ